MTDVRHRDPSLTPDARARALLADLTLDEKLAQISSVWAASLLDDGCFSEVKAGRALRHGAGQVTRIGASTVLGPAETAAVVNDLQRYCVERTRLGIPTIVHEESCAGYTAKGATQFPQAIGLASAWDPELVQAMATVIRRQMRAVGARHTLAPVLDVARDPRWGRCEETFGEDAYLTSRLGVAYVRGIQGDDLRQGVAATGKHFMGYGAPEAGLNWAPCMLPRRELLERILPPFTAAIREAGLATIMNGYQEIDGVPCGANRWLLDDLLRGELGFEGVVVADYFTVATLQSYHHIAEDKSEAAARALEAGLDLELPSRDCFGEPLAQAVAEGRVEIGLVDRAVGRMLRLKFALGLFENPYVDAGRAPELFDTAEDRALALRAGERSMVLLRNEGGLLPLDSQVGRVAVLGPSADSVRNLQGDYHYPAHLEIVFGPIHEGGLDQPDDTDRAALLPGQADRHVDLLAHFPPTTTVLDAIREVVGDATQVDHAPGCHYREPGQEGFAAAVQAAMEADVAVVVVGGRSGLLPHCTSGEAVDRATLGLPGEQEALVHAVLDTGTPTVVVVVDGRPLSLAGLSDRVPAMLYAWLPGQEGGRAIARTLFGLATPGGRLPVTLPRGPGQLPLYYNHKPSGARSQFHGEYRDMPVSPAFCFGHGLSYTRFEYTDLAFDRLDPDAAGHLEVSLTVTNVGQRAGDEVLQLYLRDIVASVTRPVQQLAGFARVPLEPGASKRIRFDLDLCQLAFYDLDMNCVVEPGEVEIQVGASCADLRLRETLRTSGDRRPVDPSTTAPTAVCVD